MKSIRSALLALVLLLPYAAQADVQFGVMANRGELKAQNQWTPMVQYLSETIGEPVELVTWPIENTYQTAEAGSVDFIVTNPAQSAALIEVMGFTPLANVKRAEGASFGGVIIANKKLGLSKGTDLKGRKVMAYNATSAGAYLFQRYHLLQQGVDVTKDFAKLAFSKKQDDIVLAVRAGMMDAGFIRTGVLESMEKDGRIKISELSIIDRVDDPNYPLIRSTKLYPSWYLMARQGVPADMVKKVQEAAFNLPTSHDAAKKAKIEGFVQPQPVAEMSALMRKLAIPPFDSNKLSSAQ
ncbi:MAG: phosphate/phosphite/phosphonate ABC transporter substrate-binding protein [Hyphomicrobiales bacterium]|nr:phosphate/phosphite/phosphonate ABC transporter substrate-binding protein [Hyphomicrobiales bacterium]